MKILAGGIYHESNSFSNIPTDIDSFRNVIYFEGPESIERLRDTTSEMAGFIRASEDIGFELIPTLWAWGVSTGPVQAEALDGMIDIVRSCFEKNGDVDGILFTLHGAMVAEQSLDGDGYILSKLREFAGDKVPIAVTLDLHANISEKMAETADIIIGYDTYPHIDQVERGYEAADLLVRTIRGEIHPIIKISKPPMVVVPNTQFSDQQPMKELIELAHTLEKEDGVLAITVSGGFAYSDVPEIGPSVIVITDNDPKLGTEYADTIARKFWDLRTEFLLDLPSVSEAVSTAVSAVSHPVILADVGDNIGAGTPGDSTFILRELLAQKAESAVVIIADPESVEKAIHAGIGSRVELDVGGKVDRLHGEPVRLVGEVIQITDGVFCNRGPMRDGIVENMGRTAVVISNGIKIVLTELKMPPWNLEQLRSVGIEPADEKIIALKSAVAFRSAYEPIAGDVILVNSPGISSIDLNDFNYEHIRKPLFPLDKDTIF
jgi:microcystin degradation protein MlrC